MSFLPIILILTLIISLLLNYMTFYSKMNAIETVNDMGFGYNIGNTFNYCNINEKEDIQNEQIQLWGTILPTQRIINKIKKYGFKTIRFQVIYNNLINESEKIKNEWIAGIKEVIDLINIANMYCILSINYNLDFLNNEGINVKDQYTNFWKEIANEFINYDEYLIFESSNFSFPENITLNINQAFIDTIRNTGGINEKRLLIIPEMLTELELNINYKYEMRKDPANKSAILLHYYFPSDYYGNNEFIPLIFNDKNGNEYRTNSIIKWGSDYDYEELVMNFALLKEYFIDKGIPIIIGEAGIITNYNNITSFMEFIYALFSLSYEYFGIMPCLWDRQNIQKISIILIEKLENGTVKL